MDVLFALALGALFTRFQIDLHNYFEDVYIKFSPTVPLQIAVSFITLIGIGRRAPLFPAISWMLLLFIVVHVSSAFRLGELNGLREGGQAAVTFVFAYAFAVRYARVPIKQFFWFFAPVAAVIMVWNIGWHIANGFYFGWKRLDNPKALFDLLPLMVAGYLWSRRKVPMVLGATLFILAGALILFSGERKAYIAFMIAIVLMLNPKNFGSYLAPLVAILLVWAGVQLSGSEYVQRQVATLLATIGIGEMPDTISTVHRAWQWRLAMLLVQADPIFGIGTNGYILANQTIYKSADYSNIGVHGEFLRIFVENGVVGLSIYCAWLVSIVTGMLKTARIPGIDSFQTRTAILWLASLFFYSAFEAINSLTMTLQYSMAFVPLLNFSNVERIKGLASLRPANA